MKAFVIGLLVLMVGVASAWAQYVHVVYRELAGDATPSELLYGPVGQYRFTLHLMDGGVPNENELTPIRFVVIDPVDNVTNEALTTTIVRDKIYRGAITLSARSNPAMQDVPYHVKFITLNDEEVITYYWALLVVTTQPATAAGMVNVDFLNIAAHSLVATQGTFGNLIVGTLDVTNQINAIDTNAVRRYGDVMSGGLTNTHGFFGNGIGITNLVGYLENGSATVNGLPITNGASITIASGGLLHFVDSATASTVQVGAMLFPTQHNARLGLFFGTNSSFSLRRPDNTITGGIARGVSSVDLQMETGLATNQTSSGGYSAIGGGRENRADGVDSVVDGGRANRASGQSSSVGGGINNTAGGQSSAIAGGSANQALATDSVIAGGNGNVIGSGGQSSLIGGGVNNAISVPFGAHVNVIGSGQDNTIEGQNQHGMGSIGAWNGIFAGRSSLLRSAPASFIGVGYFSGQTNTVYSSLVSSPLSTNLNSRLVIQGATQSSQIHSATNAFLGAGLNMRIENVANAAIIVGENLTNRTPRSVLHERTLYPMQTNVPIAVQNNHVLEAWVRESNTSTVKYVVGILNGVGFTNEMQRINI